MQMSCTCKRVKSYARSLLSIARLNVANSRALDNICSLVRIAQISRSFNGGFWPVSLPLFHGARRGPEEFTRVHDNLLFNEGRSILRLGSGQTSTHCSRSLARMIKGS
jgi:hypothetical protein